MLPTAAPAGMATVVVMPALILTLLVGQRCCVGQKVAAVPLQMLAMFRMSAGSSAADRAPAAELVATPQTEGIQRSPAVMLGPVAPAAAVVQVVIHNPKSSSPPASICFMRKAVQAGAEALGFLEVAPMGMVVLREQRPSKDKLRILVTRATAAVVVLAEVLVALVTRPARKTTLLE
jgi:hypothetical protein